MISGNSHETQPPLLDSFVTFSPLDFENSLLPREIENVMKKFVADQAIHHILPLLDELEKELALLKNQQLQSVSTLKQKVYVDTNVAKALERIKICIENQRKLEEGTLQEQEDGLPWKFQNSDLKEFLIYHNRYDLLVKLYRVPKRYGKVIQLNKEIFHLAMDKLQIPEAMAYQGNYNILTSNALIRLLSKLNEHIQEPVMAQLEKWLTPLIKEEAYLLGLSLVKNAEQVFSKRIVGNIQKLLAGESYLVPSGSDGHSSCILITRNPNETCTLIHYNTGLGCFTGNYRWKETHLYQTFDAIDNVPLESLTNENSWQHIKECMCSAPDMTSVYHTINEIIGKGGVRRPASIHKEDYDAKQSSNTCSMQVYMSILRHQVMTRVEGSKEEQEAYYKKIKAQMFLLFSKEHWSDFDNTIQNYMKPVLRKIEADLRMSSIASDPEQFNTISSEISSYLNQYSEHELAKQWNPQCESSLARYAALRNIANILSEIWMKYPEKLPTDSSEALKFALAKYDHKKIIRTILEQSFDKELESKNYENLAKKLCKNILNTSHESFILQYMVEKLGKILLPTTKDSSGIMTLFLKELHQYRALNNHIVEKLQERLICSDNGDLAQWIKDQWITLEKKDIF